MSAHTISKLLRWLAAVTGLTLGWSAQAAGGPGAPATNDGTVEIRALTNEILQVIHGAAGRAPAAADLQNLPGESLGTSLADYASNPGADPVRFESTRSAARRILAEGAPNLQTPDQTARWLAAAALRLGAQAAAPNLREDERRDAIRHAHLARFHAERMIAAVHYNLFRRALSLAELYVATQLEKQAIRHWRALVAIAGEHPDTPRWHEELQRLEAGLRELENECCPPSPAHLVAPIWQAPPL